MGGGGVGRNGCLGGGEGGCLLWGEVLWYGYDRSPFRILANGPHIGALALPRIFLGCGAQCPLNSCHASHAVLASLTLGIAVVAACWAVCLLIPPHPHMGGHPLHRHIAPQQLLVALESFPEVPIHQRPA